MTAVSHVWLLYWSTPCVKLSAYWHTSNRSYFWFFSSNGLVAHRHTFQIPNLTLLTIHGTTERDLSKSRHLSAGKKQRKNRTAVSVMGQKREIDKIRASRRSTTGCNNPKCLLLVIKSQNVAILRTSNIWMSLVKKHITRPYQII